MNRVYPGPAKEDSIVRAFLMTSEVPKVLYVANDLLNLCLFRTFLLAIFVDNITIKGVAEYLYLELV